MWQNNVAILSKNARFRKSLFEHLWSISFDDLHKCISNFTICRVIDEKYERLWWKKNVTTFDQIVSFRALYVMIVSLSFVQTYYKLKKNELQFKLLTILFRDYDFWMKSWLKFFHKKNHVFVSCQNFVTL